MTFPIRGEKLSVNVAIREVLFSTQTEFQRIEILDSEVFGRILLLDGHIQLTEFDEHAYHEALVQIPLMALNEPRAALVVGGGDGGVIRELCRCRTMERIDMVEIDVGVIEASRSFLPVLSDGAFDDPRVHVHVGDAFPFVRSASGGYDLIIVDSTDTYEGEEGALSEMIFTEEFFKDCRRLLSEGGFVVTQADNLVFCPYSLEQILGTFRGAFARVGSYQALVPSFGGFSGFAWGNNGAEMRSTFRTGAGFHYLTPETYALAFSALRF